MIPGPVITIPNPISQVLIPILIPIPGFSKIHDSNSYSSSKWFRFWFRFQHRVIPIPILIPVFCKRNDSDSNSDSSDIDYNFNSGSKVSYHLP